MINMSVLKALNYLLIIKPFRLKITDRSTSKNPDVMAGNVTTDINEIAKRIGSITFGSSLVGTGSY